jgi:predicted Zn-ribbon and HTH transcriptional regulator
MSIASNETRYATCLYCDQKMNGNGCTVTKYMEHVGFPVVERIRHGDEGYRLVFDPCRDCGAPLGTYHHPACNTEMCPKCRQQLIECEHACAMLSALLPAQGLGGGVWGAPLRP